MNIDAAFQAELFSAFCRIFWFLIAAPFLWLANTPRFLVVWLSLLLSGSLVWLGTEPGSAASAVSGSKWSMLLKESIVGLFCGLVFRMVFEAFKVYGDMVASVIGLNNVIFRSVDNSDQSGVLSSVLGMISVILMFQAGLFVQIVTFVDIHAYGDIGGIDLSDRSMFIIAMFSWAWSIALQGCFPVIILSLVVNIIAGYVNRIMPQAPFYFITAPVVMILGLVLVAHTAGFMVEAVHTTVMRVIR